jgi:hypothetical protein
MSAPKLPKNPNTASQLAGWDGYGRRGQAAYDRHFEHEKELDDAMDIRERWDREYENECNNGPTGHGDICMSDADPGL